MKKKILVMIPILAIGLVSCNGEIAKRDDRLNWNIEESSFLEEIDEIKENKKPKDMVYFLEKKSIRLKVNELNHSLHSLSKLQTEYLREYNKSISNLEYKNILSREEENIKNIKFDKIAELDEKLDFIEDKNLSNLLKEAYSSNYVLKKSSDGYKFVIDYSKYKLYDEKICPELKSYFNIRSKDSYEDLKDEISFSDIKDILTMAEKHLESYGNFEKEDILKIYSDNLQLILKGSGENSIVDKEGNFKKEILDIYNRESKENTVTGQTLKDYLDIIEASDYRLTEELMESLLPLHNRAIDLLEK